jgi:hypothetical protein
MSSEFGQLSDLSSISETQDKFLCLDDPSQVRVPSKIMGCDRTELNSMSEIFNGCYHGRDAHGLCSKQIPVSQSDERCNFCVVFRGANALYCTVPCLASNRDLRLTSEVYPSSTNLSRVAVSEGAASSTITAKDSSSLWCTIPDAHGRQILNCASIQFLDLVKAR